MKKILIYLSSIVFFLASFVFIGAQAQKKNLAGVNSIDTSIGKLIVEAVSNEFRQAAIDYLRAIQRLGTSEIQNRSVDLIINEIPKIKIIVLYETKFDNADLFGTSRNGALWIKNLNAIVISYLNWSKLTASQKQSIAAHEVFGLLRIRDNKFEVTSVFDTYLRIEKIDSTMSQKGIKLNSHALESFKAILKDSFYLRGEGGVTGVGGGGDLRPLGYKSALMIDAFVRFNYGQIEKNIFLALVKTYQMMNIEFSDKVFQGSFYLEMESLSLFIPNNALSHSNSSSNWPAIEEVNNQIIQKIRDLKNE